MYAVIDTKKSQSIDMELSCFDDALDRALQLAFAQARDNGIDEEIIGEFVNGVDPRKHPCGDWVAGACPEGASGGDWPRVEWRD